MDARHNRAQAAAGQLGKRRDERRPTLDEPTGGGGCEFVVPRRLLLDDVDGLSNQTDCPFPPGCNVAGVGQMRREGFVGGWARQDLVHGAELFATADTGGWALELQGLYLFGALAVALLGAGRYSVAGTGH